MKKFLDLQNWRYATKKYDATKKISNEDLETIKKAVQISASSYGLQPYKVLIIENKDIREKLKPVAWGQTQITDASHLLVFANIINFGDSEIDAYINNVSQTRNIPTENLEGMSNFIKSKISTLPEEERNIWTSKQTYLALANLLTATAELDIDATPMEGFESEHFNKILGLDSLGLNASVIATIGYRAEDDTTQHYAKVRKNHNDLFITI